MYQALLAKSMSREKFLWWISTSLGLGSVAIITAWIVWLEINQFWWTASTKLEFYLKMECPGVTNGQGGAGKTSEAEIDLLASSSGCVAAFLLWISPMILGMFGAVVGTIVHVLIRSQREYDNGRTEMDPVTKLFIAVMFVGVLGMWSAAGIAGADMGLSSLVFAFCFMIMVLASAALVFVVGWDSLKSSVSAAPLAKKIMTTLGSDWIKAFTLVLITPIFILVAPLSAVMQLGRKVFPFTKTLEGEEKNYFLTKTLHEQTQKVTEWPWTSVLSKVVWWCIFFFVLQVFVGKVVIVFMAWLNEVLASSDLATVTAIFFGVGLFMFLLPPVPGVPVYLSGGVILVQAGMNEFGSDQFMVSVLYSIGICFLIKLTAIVMQQKLIGEMWGSKSAYVRRLIGVNTTSMRSVKWILMQPGLNIRKVAILIGGPDWPTSVISGVLKMKLPQMLLGSVPVVVLIAPCVLGGAFLLKVGEGGFWANGSTIILTLAFIVQSVAMLAAAHFIEEIANSKSEELASWETDEIVETMDKLAAKKNRQRKHAGSWIFLPKSIRIVLLLSATLGVVSCFIFSLAGSSCFVAFQVYEPFYGPPLNGNALNIVKPLGWVAMALFLVSVVGLIIVGAYVGKHLNDHPITEASASFYLKKQKSMGNMPEDTEEDERINNKGIFTSIYQSLFRGVGANL